MSSKGEKEVIDLTESTLESSVVVISDDEMKQSAWSSPESSNGDRRQPDEPVCFEIDSEETESGPESPSSSSLRLLEEEKGWKRVEKRKGKRARQEIPSSVETDDRTEDLETSWADIRDRQGVSAHAAAAAAAANSEFDKNLPETVTLLRTPWGSKVYLVGTAHFSQESQEDVAKVIQAVQPSYVVVELCKSRSHMLMWDEEQILNEAKSVNYQMIRDMVRNNGFVHGSMYLLLLSVSAHITRELGMAPGGEFRRAFREAQHVPNCIIHLGDRPIHVTLRRALASLSWWQTIKLTFHLLFSKDPIRKEDVERCKKRDFLEEMIAEMAGEYPELKHVFVNERDMYLTYSLQNAAMMEQGPQGLLPCNVVGVVGIGHVPGITAHWDTFNYKDIPAILSVPPPSRSSRVVRVTVKASLCALVLYSLHRLTPHSMRPDLSSITTNIRNLSSTALDYLNINK